MDSYSREGDHHHVTSLPIELCLLTWASWVGGRSFLEKEAEREELFDASLLSAENLIFLVSSPAHFFVRYLDPLPVCCAANW